VADLSVSFGRSPSNRFPEAKRIAQLLPSYRCVGTGRNERHTVTIELSPTTEDTLLHLQHLMGIISGWKSSSVTVDADVLERERDFARLLAETSACYRAKRNVPWNDGYCIGKDSPADERRRFGCRLENPVRWEFKRFGSGRMVNWYEFGDLSGDHRLYHIDKKKILEALTMGISRSACALCPSFSQERLEAGVSLLPDQIDIEADDNYMIKYSSVDRGMALGIMRVERYAFPLYGDDEPEQPGDAVGRDVPAVRYSDIAAQEAALAAIEDVVGLPLRHADYFASVGVQPHRGVLLYGSPGNGKTLLAKAVAGEADAHLEIVNGPEILSKWYGESQANLRRIFERAKTYAPSVILFDEIDSIAAARSAMREQHDVALISQLLVLLDGLEERGQIIVIGTTNRIEAVDPAIRRPGRFDYHILLEEPNAQGREAILQVHLAKLRTEIGVNLQELASLTDGFSGADLAGVCREAGLVAIRRALGQGMRPDEVRVSHEDLVRATDAIRAKRSY